MNARSLTVPLAFASLLCVSASALSQSERPPLSKIWQVKAANGNFFQTTRFGTAEFVSGYTFTVKATGDGSLPVLTMACDPLFLQNGKVRLLRKHTAIDWVAYANYQLPTRSPSHQTGVLLVPGTYLAIISSDSPQSHINKQLMFVGIYLNPAEQADHWQLVAGINKLVSIQFQGSPYDVWRFTVAARGDGAIPVVTLASDEVTNSLSSTVMLFRRVAAGWVLHATWNPGVSPPRPGIPLEPGEYGVAVTAGVFGNINQYKAAVLLSGYWAAP